MLGGCTGGVDWPCLSFLPLSMVRAFLENTQSQSGSLVLSQPLGAYT